MSKLITANRTLGISYEVRSRSGIVAGNDTRSETEVNGSISGGGSYGTSGYNAPVSGSISSTTTNYQDIYLRDEEGIEHLIQTVDFLVPCQPGQHLTFFLAIPGKSEYGKYFQVFNHNTRNTYTHNKYLRQVMFPRFSSGLVVALLGLLFFSMAFFSDDKGFGESLFIGGFGAAIGGLLMWLVGSIVAALRASRVRSDAKFKQAVQTLAADPQPNQLHA
ncbi:MAG: hypothetical protein NXH95_15090 [Pseudomonadaceae bacterium]|nr:hypothetical protein [Pseudomonadaceae bacterium]